MLLTIYKKHIEEIEEFTCGFIAPNINTVAEEIKATGKRWHNWGNKKIRVNKNMSVKFYLDRKLMEGHGICFSWKGNPIITIEGKGEVWRTRPQNSNIDGSYKRHDVEALVGEIRKIKSNNAFFLAALEEDALDN